MRRSPLQSARRISLPLPPLILSLALGFLGTSVSSASAQDGQLYLSWNLCVHDGGSHTATLDCANFGAVALLASYTLAEPAVGVIGISAIIDVEFNGQAPVPPFWHFEGGGCNDGFLVVSDTRNGACASTSVAFQGSTGGFTDPYLTSYRVGVADGLPAENRAQITVSIVRASSSPVTLAASPTRHFAFRLDIASDNATDNGSGHCSGCSSVVSLHLTSIILQSQNGVVANICGTDIGSEPDNCLNNASCTTVSGDGDGDGYCAARDCDDANPDVHPGALDRVCDGIDNDCDGFVDEGNTGCVCKENAPGLRGWWRGNGNADDSAASNDGIPFGGVTYPQGLVGQAFGFDGVDDYVLSVGDAFTYSYIEDTGIFTINAWINLADVNALGQQAISANTETTTEKGHFFIWENSAGQHALRLGLMKLTSGSPYLDSSSPHNVITAPGWHHVAVVGNGLGVAFYVDGVAYSGTGVMPVTRPQGPSSRGPDIGRCPPSNHCMFHGSIDELQFHDRALTASEIRAIYQAGASGMCGTGCVQSLPGLAGWWPGEGDGADRSPNDNYADVTSVGFAPGKVGQAFSFGVTDDVPMATDWPTLEVGSQLTLAAWIRPNAVSSFQQIISKFGASPNWSYQFGLQAGGVLRCDLSGNGSTYQFVTSPSGVITASVWTHVAATFASGTVKLYVNGNLVTTGSVTFSSLYGGGSTRLNLGRDPAGIQYYSGLIDEPMVFNRALSDVEIQSIVAAGSSGMCGLGSTVAVDEPSARGGSLRLAPPWPNPTERLAHVQFTLPATANVRAEVFDVTGRRVAMLVDGTLPAGEHQLTWDGRGISGRRVKAGVYQICVTVGREIAARQVVLVD